MRYVIFAVILILLWVWYSRVNTEKIDGQSQSCGVDCASFQDALRSAADDRVLDARGMSLEDYNLEKELRR